jgi:hypothetical protein
VNDEIIVGIAQAVGRLEASFLASNDHQNRALDRIEARLTTLEGAPAKTAASIKAHRWQLFGGVIALGGLALTAIKVFGR